jgi:hypothetical protein
MKELSVFIDESGDFGNIQDDHENYLVTFVFHDQLDDISSEINTLEKKIKDLKLNVEYIHTGPIIRREGIFQKYSLDERRNLIYKILNFSIKCPVKYHCVIINRNDASDKVQLSGKIGRAINEMLRQNKDYLDSFDKVIVYYDNGQRELSSILNAIFSIHLKNVEFRKADPREYRLLQTADFFCTMELLGIKREENRLSNSEKKFFYKPNELKKTFLIGIKKKRL